MAGYMRDLLADAVGPIVEDSLQGSAYGPKVTLEPAREL